MSGLKSYTFKIIIILNLAWLCACTSTQSYKPAFNNKQTEVLKSIKTNYGFEDITFLGKKVSKNDSTYTSLVIKFINGKNIPTDSIKMIELAKQLGTQIKTIVKNPKEFETYIILFDTVVTDKGQFADVTHENYTIHEFNYSEL
jgi:hypothetical protein